MWVNPAGLAANREASVHLDLTVGTPGARGQLRQITAGFNSRGLSFGYQRDLFGGLTGHTYRLGLAGASEGLTAGFAIAYYRGETKATGWDIGVGYTRGPRWKVGGVLANIGQPVVRGLRQRATLAAGITALPLPAGPALSATVRVTSDDVIAYLVGARWKWVTARLDTDGRLRRGAFTLGLTIGGQDAIGAAVTAAGDLSTVDAASLWGVSARQR